VNIQVDKTASKQCQMAYFGVSGVETSVSASSELIMLDRRF
jgi:hypothetical protein